LEAGERWRAGFVRSPDEHRLAWADFRGNRQ
jgi:hypothetical protein